MEWGGCSGAGQGRVKKNKDVVHSSHSNDNLIKLLSLPHFFGHKTKFFSWQNDNPNNLYPSYKTDLDLWDF